MDVEAELVNQVALLAQQAIAQSNYQQVMHWRLTTLADLYAQRDPTIPLNNMAAVVGGLGGVLADGSNPEQAIATVMQQVWAVVQQLAGLSQDKLLGSAPIADQTGTATIGGSFAQALFKMLANVPTADAGHSKLSDVTVDTAIAVATEKANKAMDAMGYHGPDATLDALKSYFTGGEPSESVLLGRLAGLFLGATGAGALANSLADLSSLKVLGTGRV